MSGAWQKGFSMLTMAILLAITPHQATLVGATAPAFQEQEQRGERLRRWRERRGEAGQGEGRRQQGQRLRNSPPADSIISFGEDPAQRILFYAAPPPAPNERRRAPPLAVYIHGGGWAHGQPEIVENKPAWFRQHGWAFASLGYRLLPGAPVETQAADIGAALRRLRTEAARLGYDPDRILLFGHSAGAHLTALVSADPQYAGDAFGAIRGAILIDGAAYDVAAQIARGGLMTRRTYIPAFGTDPARQRALSPVTHAGGRDVPDWLLLYTSAREDAETQSRSLAAALDRSRVRTQLLEVPSQSSNQLIGHMEINRDFGTAGYAANDPVLAIMRRVAGH
jgi:acetyl esterase/lipase